MKYSIFCMLLSTLALPACMDTQKPEQVLQHKIDSLSLQLADTYKPGLGEFMSGIQIHHAKLWFAGQNQNWKLADFEINEILEALTDIKKYCTDREEIKSIGVIEPPVDSILKAIQQKDILQFKSAYTLLTKTCNQCHQGTNHEFNVIRTPDYPPFSNQDFKIIR